MFKKILPAITGAIGFAIAGPVGASIGAGLGSAVRGDNPANIATSALMGYGLGALGGSVGLVGGQGLGALGSSAKAAVGLGQTAAASAPTSTSALAAQMEANAVRQAATSAAQKEGLLSQVGQFIKDKPLTAGALGLGAIGALGAMDDDQEEIDMPPPPKAGSVSPLDLSTPDISYYDPATGEYGAASPTYRSLKDGGFPRKTGQISGPGTEKSDDIPAMLSDGEFVMTAKAVRGLGALNGASKDDKLEQRRKGAKQMYDMMDKLEKKVA